MDLNIAKDIVKAGQSADIDIELYDGCYSGRGMMGVETYAIVVPYIDQFYKAVMECCFRFGRSDDRSEYNILMEAVDKINSDTLGRSTIIY